MSDLYALNDAFRELMGRAPTDAEIRQFNGFATALGLKQSDAVYVLLFVYTKMSGDLKATSDAIAKAPSAVKAAIEDLSKTTLDQTSQHLSQYVKDAEAKLDAFIKSRAVDIESEKAKASQAIADVAVKMAQDMAGSAAAVARAKWTAGATFAIAIVVAAGIFGGYYFGQKSGYDAGYGMGRSVTFEEQSKAAVNLAKANALEALAKCQGKGLLEQTTEKGQPYCRTNGYAYYIVK